MTKGRDRDPDRITDQFEAGAQAFEKNVDEGNYEAVAAGTLKFAIGALRVKGIAGSSQMRV